MHTFCGKHNAVFHYNGDLSGEVIIGNKLNETTVKVEMSDLLEFGAYIYADLLDNAFLKYKKDMMQVLSAEVKK